ncbi:MAG: nucleotidyltransferase domain-containing protein [Acidobacteria bacterium]|nr:nucleotidyltransferase domain-containing protein [Acidobacteriota bacterium]MCY3966708.1 nucleotidyltransferase domain-containing protein [Acidobacteriota bacterium]
MPVTSTTSSVKHWPSSETVLDALNAWGAAAARRRDDLLALGYFGSYARGDAGFGSDLDLILIVASDHRRSMERAIDWRTDSLPVPTDLIVYTQDEWRRLQAGGGRFARTLQEEAQWLWNSVPPRAAKVGQR